MTFDREPDLDNANVGMPEHKCMYNGKLPKLVVSRFLFTGKAVPFPWDFEMRGKTVWFLLEKR